MSDSMIDPNGIREIQRAQRDNLHNIAQLKPSGRLGMAIKYAAIEFHRLSVYYTHVDTGALRGSHRIEVMGLHGRIYIDPTSVNPRGQKPSQYGPVEHARGGSHAFYQQAVTKGRTSITQSWKIGFVRSLAQ